MDTNSNRALAIRELKELAGLSQEQMLEFLDQPSYNEILFRNPSKNEKEHNKRPTVATNLKLKTADCIENSFGIEKHSLHLEYAYRKIFQKPCNGLSTIDIFLRLFQEALNLKYNDIFDEDYVQSIRERREPNYISDKAFFE